MRAIRTRLLMGLMSGALLCTLAVTMLLYLRADHEADEQSDQRLRQLAWSLPLQSRDGWQAPPDTEPEDVFYAQAWDATGRPVHLTTVAPALPLPQPQGYATISYKGERWRVYSETIPGFQVQVSQPIAARQRLAAHMALRIAPPLLLLPPAMAIMIWVVVGSAMAPLEHLTRAVQGRTPAALQPLESGGLPPELRPIVEALNTLLVKVDGAMTAQRNFVADAAHELRSPLTALKLQLDLAERANGEGDRQQAFRKLHERLDRATHLVRQLMTLARQEQSDASPARTACDLVRIAHQVVSDHLIYADSRQIELNFTTTLTALPLMAHAEGLGVMLNNLVDNALRYTQAGGRVDVLVRTERGCPSVVVADNGPGVPKEGRERLFDRFYRPEGNQVWGSGLGLSIVKSVADAHHASLRLDTNGHSGLMVTAVFPIS